MRYLQGIQNPNRQYPGSSSGQFARVAVGGWPTLPMRKMLLRVPLGEANEAIQGRGLGDMW
jgi:hypothetical protein